ncbi:MAG: ribonuclease HII [Candidatus Baldrarchaeia archaeon]
MYIAGIDEAGRGPVIGPMVIAGVLITEEDLGKLAKLNVRDSKMLSRSRRIKLAEEILRIAKNVKIIEVSPSEIDNAKGRGISLNVLEAMKIAEIIISLKPDIIYVDSPDIFPDRFAETVKSFLPNELKEVTIVSEHKADAKFQIVSAASIVAKVHRDRIITRLKVKYGDFGSGYPSDWRTIRFLQNYVKQYHDVPDIVRKSWKTVRKILESIKSG